VDKLGSAYASVLASEGVSDPVQAAEGLFKTVAQLRMGSPQQKAQQIAQLIEHYGVDIQQLDSQLVNTPEAQQNTELERMVSERMQPYEQVMQQFNQQQESQHQQARTNADSQVAEFGKTAEFLNDVREPMAAMIDAAAGRGENLDLKRAYAMACAIDPQISKVLEGRKQQEAITGQKQSLQSKQAAASTLNGRRGAVSSGQGAMSLREHLAASWDGSGEG
jgi:replication initiation and membrane attachment protein DnaB